MPTMAFDPESIRSWSPPDGGELLATDVFTGVSLGPFAVTVGVAVRIPGVDASIILTTTFDTRKPHDVRAIFDARYREVVAEIARHRATVAGEDLEAGDACYLRDDRKLHRATGAAVAPTSWHDLAPLL